MKELRVTNLSVQRRSRSILSNLEMIWPGGQIGGIIGPNGSGKSTLIKAIAGLMPASGTIDAADSGGMPVKRSSIAYVSQLGNTQSSLTVFEMILLGRTRHLPWAAGRDNLEATAEAIEKYRLGALSSRPFSTLSGGQRQLVMLAQALVARPHVLLLDEPTSALDLHHQLQVLDLVKAYTREYQAITLTVLHDLALAARYCHTLTVLVGGRIRAAGSPAHILTPALLREVYGVEIDIGRTTDGHATVTPTRRLHEAAVHPALLHADA